MHAKNRSYVAWLFGWHGRVWLVDIIFAQRKSRHGVRKGGGVVEQSGELGKEGGEESEETRPEDCNLACKKVNINYVKHFLCTSRYEMQNV